MPFQSEKQRRFLHANHPEIAKRWERDYANGGISNHFRKKFASGSWTPGAGRDTSGYQSSHSSYSGGQGNQGGPPGITTAPTHIPKGPTIAEIDAQKKAAANEKKLSRQQKYESDRAARKRQKRIDYMLDRRAKGKGYSQKNLQQLTTGYETNRPGFYGNVPTYDPLATRNVGIASVDNKMESILPQEKPNLFPDYSNVGSRHPFIMNKGTTLPGTRPPEWVTGIPKLGPIDPGSTNPLFTNRGLTEELSTKDYTSSEPYWSDETGEGQWYDAKGNPIDNPNINPEFASMIKPIAAVKEDFVKKQSWYKSPLKLKQKTISTALSKDGAKKIQAFKDLKGMVPKGTLTIEKYLDLSKKGKIPSIIAEDMNEQVLEAIKEQGGFEETFQEDWSSGVVEPTFKGGKLDIDVEALNPSEMVKPPKHYLEVAEGGVARKNYFHGGILDINESEEIISDDGNDIELTDYNAAFDEPTGVKSLFQAKDGGRIGYQWGGPGGKSPGTSASHGQGSDRGPRDDPDRFGPVSKPQTVPEGINIHDWKKDEDAYVMVDGEKVPQSIWGTSSDPRENPNRRTKYGANYKHPFNPNKKVTYEQREVLKRIETKLKGDWQKYIDPTLVDQLKLVSSLTGITGILTAVFKQMKTDKEMREMMELMESIGLAKGPPGTNDPLYDRIWLYQEKKKAKYKKETKDEPAGPIYAPLTGAVDEEYAQGYYDYGMSDLDKIRALQAKRAMINPDWQQQPGLAFGQQLFNSGGLANLFRVKNNQ